MANPNNPKQNWLDDMKDRRRALQMELEQVDLGQPDVALAAQVRGVIAEIKALNDAIEGFTKYFTD